MAEPISGRGDHDQDDHITLVVGSDDNYAIGVAVTVHSALVNLSPNSRASVVVVDGGMSETSRARIERAARTASPNTELRWHVADSSGFDGLKTTKWGSTANYLRLLIPDILNPDERWALYLDSDLLVRSDLSELWQLKTRLGDEQVMAVRDYHNPTLESVFGREGVGQLGLDPGGKYFNSGMLVIDVDAWRSHDTSQKAVDFVRENASIMRHSDQDALNAILAEEWFELDPLWNVMVPSIGRMADRSADGRQDAKDLASSLLDRGHIYHFTGPRKPWIAGYLGPGSKEYRSVLATSGWFGSTGEHQEWSRQYRKASPAAWAREGRRRLRKKVATTIYSLRPRNGSGDR